VDERLIVLRHVVDNTLIIYIYITIFSTHNRSA